MNQTGIGPLLVIGLLLAIFGGVVAYKVGFFNKLPVGSQCGSVLDPPCVSNSECRVADPVSGVKSCQVTNVPQFIFDQLSLSSLICGSGVQSGLCTLLLPALVTGILAILFFFATVFLIGSGVGALLAALLGALIGFVFFPFFDRWWWSVAVLLAIVGFFFSLKK